MNMRILAILVLQLAAAEYECRAKDDDGPFEPLTEEELQEEKKELEEIVKSQNKVFESQTDALRELTANDIQMVIEQEKPNSMIVAAIITNKSKAEITCRTLPFVDFKVVPKNKENIKEHTPITFDIGLSQPIIKPGESGRARFSLKWYDLHFPKPGMHEIDVTAQVDKRRLRPPTRFRALPLLGGGRDSRRAATFRSASDHGSAGASPSHPFSTGEGVRFTVPQEVFRCGIPPE